MNEEEFRAYSDNQKRYREAERTRKKLFWTLLGAITLSGVILLCIETAWNTYQLRQAEKAAVLILESIKKEADKANEEMQRYIKDRNAQQARERAIIKESALAEKRNRRKNKQIYLALHSTCKFWENEYSKRKDRENNKWKLIACAKAKDFKAKNHFY